MYNPAHAAIYALMAYRLKLLEKRYPEEYAKAVEAYRCYVRETVKEG